MEQAGVVLVVGLAAQLAHEAGVNVVSLAQLQQLLVRLKPPVFRHAQEHHAIDRHLHGGVQVVGGKSLVAQGDVAGQRIPPALDFLEELHVHFRRAALPLGRGVLVERPGPDGFAREHVPKLPPAVGVLLEAEVVNAGMARLVAWPGRSVQS